MKKNLVVYTHAPSASPGVQGLHIMLFKILEVFERDYNIYVLCRTHQTYEFYQERFMKQQPYLNLIDVPDNMTDSAYTFGLMEKKINTSINGKIDKAFWFWPGMQIAAPEERILQTYKNLESGIWNGKTIQIKDKIDGSVVQQAEMLYAVIKHQPRFIYRVGDYTEPHIEHIGYPMKLVSYYPSKSRGHMKIHDAEWFHFSDPIPEKAKEFDFSFGYTVEIPERAYLSDFCFSHIKQNDKVKLYVKDKHFSKYAPINTQLQSDEYFDVINRSKFSLIAPSTDPEEVSINRVYEDIARRCIPIFMKSVRYEKAFDEEMSNFIRDNLVYDEEKIPVFNDFLAALDYDSLLKKIFSLKMIQQFQDRNWLYQKMLEETT